MYVEVDLETAQCRAIFPPGWHLTSPPEAGGVAVTFEVDTVYDPGFGRVRRTRSRTATCDVKLDLGFRLAGVL